MAKIIPFKKKTLSEKHKGGTLCRNGHHAWAIDKGQQFDVKQGKLVTLYRCRRCKVSKQKLI
ncbi:hypothetical protein [Cycloclasticus sp.]|uniref:hypothetical protein n=1 Tax=Cycloclasticus sp. TaxID=2024830 RepID=UPI000C11E30A|nr:hypothetical protein [Cycloclasticus sp.]PHR51503.1 MAG: hypothetical protein COA48_00055 [Cycloclasticus sp.]